MENCDAEGYVSEKLFDALCAGCIPLYHGNLNTDLLHVDPQLYVDIRGMSLQKLAQTVLTMDVQKARAYIVQNRTSALQQVGTARFAELMTKALTHQITQHLKVYHDSTLFRSHLPRVHFVLVHQADGRFVRQANVRYVYTTAAVPWDPAVAKAMVQKYNIFFGTNKTVGDLGLKITGAYSLLWNVFDQGLEFANAMQQFSPYSEALLIALALCDLNIKIVKPDNV